MKKEILILGILLVVSATLGCTSNTQSGKQSGNSINFAIPDGWELHSMPGEGIVIWLGDDPRIRVIEMKDPRKYNSKHNSALNIDKTGYMVKTQNKTIEGINVEIFKTNDNRFGDIQDNYFFQKNNKYYYIMAWAYPGWDSSKQNKYRREIDKAITIIVKTIN